jgi:DNA-binding transcriptional MerR regulator
MGKLLSIEKAAQKVRLSPNTLRNWERQGVINPVARINGNGLRVYSQGDLEAIRNTRRKRFGR